MGDLDRFRDAHADTFDQALAEIRDGRKVSHWMWFIFPQIAGLGRSSTAQFYALADLDEARAFLADPVLGKNLRAISEALLTLAGKCSAAEIFGPVDAMKLKSSMTLFAHAAPEAPIFSEVVQAFFDGEEDSLTLALI